MLVKDAIVAEPQPRTKDSNTTPMSKEERYELIARVARSLEESSSQDQFDYIDETQREVMQPEIDFEYYIRTLN